MNIQTNGLYKYRCDMVVANVAMERSTMLLIGKPSINWPFSMAMLNNQMVYLIN